MKGMKCLTGKLPGPNFRMQGFLNLLTATVAEASASRVTSSVHWLQEA